jgi:SAM-dependent methyltransferase
MLAPRPHGFTAILKLNESVIDGLRLDVRHRDAVALIADAPLDRSAPSRWADLGSGDGTFTLALADLLAPGSVVHAIDRDRASLASIPRHRSVRIETHVADFVVDPWPVAAVDGILMANSLHYVSDQGAFLQSCASRLTPGGVFLFVEYDTDRSNPWVPHPVSVRALTALFAGWGQVAVLGTRPSAFRRSPLYAAMVRIGGLVARVTGPAARA